MAHHNNIRSHSSERLSHHQFPIHCNCNCLRLSARADATYCWLHGLTANFLVLLTLWETGGVLHISDTMSQPKARVLEGYCKRMAWMFCPSMYNSPVKSVYSAISEHQFFFCRGPRSYTIHRLCIKVSISTCVHSSSVVHSSSCHSRCANQFYKDRIIHQRCKY